MLICEFQVLSYYILFYKKLTLLFGLTFFQKHGQSYRVAVIGQQIQALFLAANIPTVKLSKFDQILVLSARNCIKID